MDSHLLLSLVIPCVFLVLTGMIKCLIKHGFPWDSFYLGVDIALTAFANAIINVVDLGGGIVHPNQKEVAGFASKMYYNAMLLVLSFGVLLIVMFIHQRLENATPPGFDGRSWKRHIWLGGVANITGAGSLAVFIIARLRGIL